jgi:hypothetical protein
LHCNEEGARKALISTPTPFVKALVLSVLDSGQRCLRFGHKSAIDEWKADVFGGPNTERYANRITVSSETHVY